MQRHMAFRDPYSQSAASVCVGAMHDVAVRLVQEECHLEEQLRAKRRETAELEAQLKAKAEARRKAKQLAGLKRQRTELEHRRATILRESDDIAKQHAELKRRASELQRQRDGVVMQLQHVAEQEAALMQGATQDAAPDGTPSEAPPEKRAKTASSSPIPGQSDGHVGEMVGSHGGAAAQAFLSPPKAAATSTPAAVPSPTANTPTTNGAVLPQPAFAHRVVNPAAARQYPTPGQQKSTTSPSTSANDAALLRSRIVDHRHTHPTPPTQWRRLHLPWSACRGGRPLRRIPHSGVAAHLQLHAAMRPQRMEVRRGHGSPCRRRHRVLGSCRRRHSRRRRSCRRQAHTSRRLARKLCRRPCTPPRRSGVSLLVCPPAHSALRLHPPHMRRLQHRSRPFRRHVARTPQPMPLPCSAMGASPPMDGCTRRCPWVTEV